MIAGSSLFFLKFIWNVLCLCHYGPALLRFWFQTNLGCENSGGHLEMPAGKTFSCQGHALVTLYVQFLCSDWSKCDRWLHVENLCSILHLVYFDSWSWQSFCLFPLDVQKWNTAAINSRLSKSEIRFRMALFSFFTLLEKPEAILPSPARQHTMLPLS